MSFKTLNVNNLKPKNLPKSASDAKIDGIETGNETEKINDDDSSKQVVDVPSIVKLKPATPCILLCPQASKYTETEFFSSYY